MATAQHAAKTQNIYMNFLNCQQPLLLEPPANLADRFQTSVTPDEVLNKIPWQNKRNHMAFMLCLVIAGVNEAAFFWKQIHCDETTANFNKTFDFELHDKSVTDDSKREVKVWN